MSTSSVTPVPSTADAAESANPPVEQAAAENPPAGSDTQPAVETTVVPSAAARKVAELSTSKVLAGGMAAATSAVLGSHFGAFGTVGGAAVGSVITTVATSLYQSSLLRAKERVACRVPVSAPTLPRPHLPRGRTVRAASSGAFLIFAVGIALVTGVEWAKGAPLSGGSPGTSLGRVFSPAPTVKPAPTDIAPAPSGADHIGGTGTGGSGGRQPDTKQNPQNDPSAGLFPGGRPLPSAQQRPPLPSTLPGPSLLPEPRSDGGGLVGQQLFPNASQGH